MSRGRLCGSARSLRRRIQSGPASWAMARLVVGAIRPEGRLATLCRRASASIGIRRLFLEFRVSKMCLRSVGQRRARVPKINRSDLVGTSEMPAAWKGRRVTSHTHGLGGEARRRLCLAALASGVRLVLRGNSIVTLGVAWLEHWHDVDVD